MEKVIVIGTNHAGTYAVSTLADNYKDTVEVVTYDRNNNISFLGCGMALWIGGVIDNPEGLFYASPESLKEKGINVYMEHDVTNVDFKNKKIEIKDLNSGNSSEETYDKLIIAVGSWPIKPNLPGIDLENVIYAKLYQHAIHAKKIMSQKEVKKIAVVGGGYIGIELAESFIQNGKEVVLINNQNILNRYYDDHFTEIMHKRLADNGVVVAEYEEVTEIVGDTKVEKIVTNKNEYEVDVVLMAVGFHANTKFLAGKELETNDRGVILVNNNQETNISDVYAVGDCATVYSNADDEIQNIALATNAVRTGIIAGHNAGGTKLAMNGVQGSNAIHIFGLTLCSTGLTEKVAKEKGYETDSVTVTDNLRPEFMPNNNEVTLKIVWDKKTLKILGAQMMSNEDITLALHTFSLAIEVDYTIDKLATLDLFFLPHFNKPENFITKAGLIALAKVSKY